MYIYDLNRYYSISALDHIHRAKALEEWWKLGEGVNVPLERALGAFDMFVLHGESGDLFEVGGKDEAFALF